MNYPHPKGAKGKCGGILHETGGLPGNWAYDFLAPGGTPVLAVQDGTISYLSGHDPSTGTWRNGRPDPTGDVYGWTIYLRVADGFYFTTHYGYRYVKTGQRVKAGQMIGRVGHWPHDEGRSHTHAGFTADKGGKTASVKRIKAVAAAPRVKPLGSGQV